MNLVIDVGNTLLKFAIFKNDAIQLKKTCLKKDFLETLTEALDSFPDVHNCIVSTVANLSEHQLLKLQQRVPVFELTHSAKIPFSNLYRTPTTLGVDRIALVSAAAKLFQNSNVLVVDAGSCITYDFLSENKEYLGGAISPGIEMRYKALNTFTEKLPLLDVSSPKKLIGNSTATAIHSGVVRGVLYEIDGFIEAYSENYSDLTIILTGGDAHFLRDSLKNGIFANSNFLLEGLNYILELNKD
ncbi:type III pantothenate kinase [Ulvibacter sp. MAR_2010_11]|uniref:type III pantothenate kinase n=1 Tax=Ulvibacter sp. MAR_2010_11 TaxID=1250229 RepID=UPI000C2CB806|nr:type III pantothenate kinase [Ulvibacter sp. MAR_2010_11]PKA82523.1 type III pantothenate kinase [Ulvibacter sp. MAR_2010_11]